MLASRQELQNTRRKLASLRELIARRTADPTPHPAKADSLNSLCKLERELEREIAEFEQRAAARP
jgi:hypothetical protein